MTKAKERAGDNPIREQIAALHKKLETFANPATVRSGAPLELDALKKVEKLFRDLQAVDAAPVLFDPIPRLKNYARAMRLRASRLLRAS